MFLQINQPQKESKGESPSLIGCGVNIVNKDEEKAEVLNAFFASVCNNLTGYSQGSQPPVLVDREGLQNKPSIMQEEEVNDLLCHLDTYNSMQPDGIH